MKGIKLIISLASALVMLAAVICAVVIFQEELNRLYGQCKDYCCKVISGAKKEEFADFADV